MTIVQRKVNQKLKELKEKYAISEKQYQHLYSNSSLIPLFYALIKVHKINYPIRPIVSFIETPTYQIA